MQNDDTAASLTERYSIEQLAPGSYDLLLDDRLVGGIVRNISNSGRMGGWRVELLDDEDGRRRPTPFTASEHVFTGLDAALPWLGISPTSASD